jgi:hypothetical protein
VGTFLTTPKMPPALRERVEDSVRGRRHHRSDRKDVRARLTSLVRFSIPIAVAALVVAVTYLRHQDRLELERSRASLLGAVGAQTASLTPDERGKMALIESWLVRLSGAYEGDLVADELRSPGLDAVLARPAVYVRGPVGSFSAAPGVAAAAALSFDDSFVACLFDPPPSRSEKVALAKVRALSGAGSGAHANRLDDGERSLPFLLPAWTDRIRSVADLEGLDRLRREFERAPIDRGRQVFRAALLLVAMDEPAPPGGPTELDGERPHDVRVGIVDLTAERILLRTRKHLDPGWISANTRSVYARALDDCALALDVRERVNAPHPGK